ncbi:MAG: SpoIIE family protein phosphatase [bacterium]|nr:SpoIIE family protein phosphatase [bacterium]
MTGKNNTNKRNKKKLFAKIIRVEDFSLLDSDQGVMRKIARDINENDISHVFIISPPTASSDTDSFEAFEQVSLDLDCTIRFFTAKLPEKFTEEELKKDYSTSLKNIVEAIYARHQEEKCLVVFNSEYIAGVVLACFYITAGYDVQKAIKILKEYDSTLVRNDPEIAFIEKFYAESQKSTGDEEEYYYPDAPAEPVKGLKAFLDKYSIQTKLMFITSMIIIASLLTMIILATFFFKDDSEIRVRENNLKIARLIGYKVESDISSYIENARIMASIMKGDTKADSSEEEKKLLSKNKEIIFLGLAKKKGKNFHFTHSLYNEDFLSEFQIRKKNVQRIHRINRNSFLNAFNESTAFHNISVGKNIPILGISAPLTFENGRVDSIIILYIKMDRFLKIFKNSDEGSDEKSTIMNTFMVNEVGELIAHSNSKMIIANVNFKNKIIVKKMLSSQLNNGQKRYKDSDGLYHLGSFKKLDDFGLGIIVTVNEDKIFEAVYGIQRRNIIILLIVLCVSVLIVFFFAKSVTIPIVKLVEETHNFQETNLPVHAIKGKDEVSFLTISFHAMIESILDSQRKLQDYADNLELKVEERTKELKEARDELWGEMKLAQKIQTVLLPEEPAIPGYEITGYMMPADEVGGDYYDVINVEGYDWIVVGDVSGHGVPAGLVMMMVQTSVRVALAQKPDCTPAELLTAVNRAVAYNIKRLGEHKYMTIAIFACFKDGLFHYAGLHLDLLLYRADSGDVDYINTDGMWIGIMDEIGEYLPINSFTMNSNDILLLYTDGVTECLDKEGEMFSTEKLAEVLARIGKKSVEEIKQDVIKELEDYIRDDDVTMVVMKRL